MKYRIIYPTGGLDGGNFGLDDDKALTLEEKQQRVGGYIEEIRLNDKEVMIVNDNGKNINLPFNKKATRYYHNRGTNVWPDLKILGTVIVEERGE